MADHASLRWALTRLAQLNAVPLDALRLQEVLAGTVSEPTGVDALRVCRTLDWHHSDILKAPDRALLPLLCQTPEGDWGLLVDAAPDGSWQFEGLNGLAAFPADSKFPALIRARLGKSGPASTFRQIVRDGMRPYRGRITEAIVATFFINLLAALTAFFTMQVYNKVIPSRGIETLIVLLIGVVILISFEWVMKAARSRVMEGAVAGLDAHLSRDIFARLLKVRLDRMPSSVGTLASQLRGYEQVRALYTSNALFSLVDIPAALIFVTIITLVASPWLAAIPLMAGLVTIGLSLLVKRQIKALAKETVTETNMKTGLLVEVVEGAETIKAAQGGWRFLSQWVDLSTTTITHDQRMRRANERLTYLMSAAQHYSQAILVSAGAWLVIQGELTIGALIASSILGSRVLAAVMHLPQLIMQYSYTQAAMEGIEAVYALDADNQGVARPLVPSRLSGEYILNGIRFGYPEAPPALYIPRLAIQAGERVVILGPIGSGKSTLLKILAGLYAPDDGQVLLDGMDVAQIAREAMSRNVAYLQQDYRLFQGTLRDNLLIGLTDPGDDAMQTALHTTGLINLVANHPRGLDLPIYEGGRGLSGGQKQLVAFTRLLLAQPNVLLLDEPTASMDDNLEQRCIAVLDQKFPAAATLILVTHKPAMLALATRVLVVAGGRLVMDGARDEIVARLRQIGPSPAGPTQIDGTPPASALAAPNGDTP